VSFVGLLEGDGKTEPGGKTSWFPAESRLCEGHPPVFRPMFLLTDGGLLLWHISKYTASETALPSKIALSAEKISLLPEKLRSSKYI
jgi:hypothetical protein